jgi:hypothetical protein
VRRSPTSVPIITALPPRLDTRKAAGRSRRQLPCWSPRSDCSVSRQIAKYGTPIDRASISKIETGTRFVLDYEIVALAKVLGVSVGWLLGERGRF